MITNKKLIAKYTSAKYGSIIYLFLYCFATYFIIDAPQIDSITSISLSFEMLIFYFIWKALGNSLSFTNFTLPSFFILFYIILITIPSTYIYTTMDSPVKEQFLLVMHAGLFLILAGIFFTNILIVNHREIIDAYNRSHIPDFATSKKNDIYVHIAIIFSIIVLIIYFGFSNYVPLIEVILKYPTDIDEQTLRFAENELPGIVQLIYEATRRVLIPLVVVYSYIRHRQVHGIWTKYFFFYFIYGAFFNVLTLDRGPIIILFLFIGITKVVLFRDKNLLIYSAIFFAIGAIGGFVSILQYQREISFERFIEYSLYIMGWRIFIDPVFMATIAFDNFNYETGFLYGESTRLFSLFVPSYEWLESRGGSYHRNWAGAPATFVGDLWRNFALTGVIVGCFSLGALYQLIQLKLIVNKAILTNIATFILMLYPAFIIHGNMFGIATTMIFLLGIFLAWIGSKKNSFRISI
jgi:hypothetical protein